MDPGVEQREKDGSTSDPTRQGVHGADGAPPVKMIERVHEEERAKRKNEKRRGSWIGLGGPPVELDGDGISGGRRRR